MKFSGIPNVRQGQDSAATSHARSSRDSKDALGVFATMLEQSSKRVQQAKVLTAFKQKQPVSASSQTTPAKEREPKEVAVEKPEELKERPAEVQTPSASAAAAAAQPAPAATAPKHNAEPASVEDSTTAPGPTSAAQSSEPSTPAPQPSSTPGATEAAANGMKAQEESAPASIAVDVTAQEALALAVKSADPAADIEVLPVVTASPKESPKGAAGSAAAFVSASIDTEAPVAEMAASAAAPAAAPAVAPAAAPEPKPASLLVDDQVANIVVSAAVAEEMPAADALKLPSGSQAPSTGSAGSVQTLLAAAVREIAPDTSTAATVPGSSEGATATPAGTVLQAPVTQNGAAVAATPRVESVQVATVQSVGQVVVKSVRLMISNGEQSLTVRLIPDNLGELHLEVKSVQDALHVRLMSGSPAVRDALESQLGSLRDALSKSGIDAATLTVSTDPAGGQGSQNLNWGNARENVPARAAASGARTLEHSLSSPNSRTEAAHDGLLNICI